MRFKTKPDGTPDGGVHGSSSSPAAATPRLQHPAGRFLQRFESPFRIPTPTFGAGLIEAITDSTLRSNLAANAAIKAALGITGKLNTSGNDGTVIVSAGSPE